MNVHWENVLALVCKESDKSVKDGIAISSPDIHEDKVR